MKTKLKSSIIAYHMAVGHRVAAAMVCALCAGGLAAFAAVPQAITYRGVLTRTSGYDRPMMLELTFRLYDSKAPEKALWARTMRVPVDTNGVFYAELSDANGSDPDGIGFTLADAMGAIKGTPEIGLTPPKAAELKPRQQLATGVRAARAARAKAADERAHAVYERVLYNNVLGAIGADGRHFFYRNPLTSALVRDSWHGSPCCVGNIARTLLALKDNLLAVSADGTTLYVNNYMDIETDDFRMETAYPFDETIEIAVKEAKPKCVMTAYNGINGIWSGANFGLIEGILRSEWGFTGLVMTDWCARSHLWQNIAAGNDVKMPVIWEHDQPGAKAMHVTLARQGKINPARIKASVKRVLRLVMESSRFKSTL